ncbi:MAG: DPP IV N-terminal domain-containing protein [Longimicrobiales bacterium]
MASPGLRPLRSAALLLALALVSAPPAPAPAQTLDAALGPMSETRYSRAERLLAWHTSDDIAGDAVVPTWMAGGQRFWYRNQTPDGAEFVLADPSAGTRSPLFDRHRLASAMSLAADTAFVGTALPFRAFDFAEGSAEQAIRFDAGGRGFTCDIRAYTCQVGDTLPDRTGFVRSPDGALEAFVHEHDLWIRPVAGGDSTRLTDDGEELWAYGVVAPRPGQIVAGTTQRPVLQWSPDSRRIAVQRMDEREVPTLTLYSSTHTRPKGYTYPYPLPEDSILPRFDIHVVDVDGARNVRIDLEPQPYSTFTSTGMNDSTWVTVKWKEEGRRLYFTHATRGAKSIILYEADLSTGEARAIVGDTSATHVELNLDIVGGKPNWDVVNGGQDVLWFSERDGWGHLYRFGPDGRLKNRVTSGPWTFGDLLHVDEDTDRLWFRARGREAGRLPTLAHLYSVSLDGTGLTLLSPEDADHTVRATPDGRFFVDAYSRPDLPPVSVVRDRNGRVVRTLEEADVSAMRAAGWTPPRVFSYVARDGVTTLHGLMYLPSDFDSTAVYPVVEYIYPGPFIGSVGTWNFGGGASGQSGRGDQDALAELGFVVLQMDHLGTSLRSKAILDHYWGNMGDNGLPDHVAALRQLGTRHAFMDLDRVGIYGHSGGGFASTDAILRYPDVYKVAVSSSGNHDNRTYHAAYAEKYQGLLTRDTVRGTDSYANQVNASLAANLQGKLFLMTGDMDDNVHPAMTLQVADALIDANKSFDFLVLPDRAHGLNEPYVVRRRWDYFVQHLMGREPPKDFRITRPSG